MNVVRTIPLEQIPFSNMVFSILSCLGYLIFYIIILRGDKDQFIPPIIGWIAIISGVAFLITFQLFNYGYNLGPLLLFLCFICGPAGIFAFGLSGMFLMFLIIQFFGGYRL